MKKLLFLLLGFVLPPYAIAINDEEPLPPDQAFLLSSTMVDANTLRTTWTIVDGYYLYREKFQFVPDNKGVSFSPPTFPLGKIKEDEFFGKVETYRHKAVIDIPIIRGSYTGNTLQFTTVSQGCADIGVCYPPQTQKVSVQFPPNTPTSQAALSTTAISPIAAEATPTADSGAFSVLKKLGNSFGLGANNSPFLDVDQAFAYSSEVVDGSTLAVQWKIADGYYLYREKFSFEVKDAAGVSIGSIAFPKGEMKVDEAFGNMEVYHDAIELKLPLIRTDLSPGPITLVTKYQGCAEKGFCYPPQERALPVSLPAATATSVLSAPQSPIGPLTEQDRIAASLTSGSKLLTVLSFFGFGLLLAFTPCVFPMIPILSSIIVGQGEGLTTRRAFILSLTYVLAMAITYTVAGVIAGLFGENLQAAFQNPWILGTFAAIFVALSLSMFGFYDLQMPSFLQSRLTEISNKQKGGTLLGVGVMGFLSALIVGPCVAAPLAGALIYIGQTGDAVLGGLALFSLSLGMGAPLLAIGTSAGKILPKAGEWMNTIKAVFGIMLIAVAIWMLERIIPAQITMLAWATLLIVSAIYMGGLEPYGVNANGWRKLWKGLGLVMLTYGILLIIGATSGGTDPLQPLHKLSMETSLGGKPSTHVNFKRVKGLPELEREIAAANAQGHPVMLDFYADWCISCKEMEKYTFSDADVQKVLARAVLLQADVTANDDADKALLKHFGLIGPPSILFFDTSGQERRAYRLVGLLKAQEFRALAEGALGS